MFCCLLLVALKLGEEMDERGWKISTRGIPGGSLFFFF